ncbi:MAG: peptide chain release factor 2 [Candidatus Magasanikbacteria bacterium]|nr:peptide chain release factor 2 [Candidatus Magasanikbacteria bacterium]MCA9389323.1 peptide chain release factor 2 [Candidatus Magasanikbacteria bacterium]MCA9391018.1 peptide chain release factor 2 [Candidatus Magasanikbacteria bacterium]USN52618.1 MAG: peptide chain release factor 2 [Candidatus Nomurabacteria bacterium]HPF95392.1 peptide chain release factor 2 [bacterium]
MIQELREQLLALKTKVDEAWGILALDTTKKEIAALEAETMSADFWQDQERATRESQKLAELRREIEEWEVIRLAIADSLELLDMAESEKDQDTVKEIEKKLAELETEFTKLEFSLMFSGDHDQANAIIGIHAGAGGTDAQDWAEMIMRMLFRFAERKGWKVQLLDESRGGEAGIKSAVFRVEGRFAYGHLKSEHGVHRLVRQSPFNADALRQTSFALVEVIPEIEHDSDIEIKNEDLRIDTFTAGGKGGQSVNTTYSAVRIVHLPTGIMVSCQNERSQTQNKEFAMRVLKSKLAKLREEELQKEKQQLRGEYQSAEWGNQIRSYVLHPYKMVKDHRTDVETADPEKVLDGDIDAFIEGYLRMEAGKHDVPAELNKD